MTKTRQPILRLALLLIVSLGLTACDSQTANSLNSVVTVKPTIKTSSTIAATTITRKETTTTTTTPSAMTASALPSKTLVQVFPALANIQDATAIRVQNYWYGWTTSGLNSRSEYYWLERKNNQFEGQGRLGLSSTTAQVIVPFNAAQNFLQMLTQIPIEEGEYIPYIDHTDDDYKVTVQVNTPTGTLCVFTQSQNKENSNYNLPWGLQFGGRTFVVNSPIAAQALAELQSHLSEQPLFDIAQEEGQIDC